MSLNKTYSTVHKGKHFSDAFPIQNGLKQGHASSPLLLNCASEYTRNIQQNKEGLELNGTNELLVCADNLIMLNYWMKT
jgi:hypothetical protein